MAREWERPRSITGVRLMVEHARDLGLDTAAILERADLVEADLEDSVGNVWAWQEVRVLQGLVERTDPVELGPALGRRAHLTAYGVVGLAMLSAPTVGDLLALARSYRSLLMVLCRVSIRRTAGNVQVILDSTSLPTHLGQVAAVRDLFASRTLLEEALGAEVPWTIEVDPSAGHSVARVSVSAHVLATALPQADRTAHREARLACDALMARKMAMLGVADQIRNQLWNSLPDIPDLDEVAGSLATTARTLRRRLTDEGTSFRSLVDETRRRAAADLLAHGRLTVEQVAERLGYHDQSAFRAAFRRWTGMSPSSWRP